MSVKRVKLNKRGKLAVMLGSICIALLLVALYLKMRPMIIFNSEQIEVEINESFDPLAQIKKQRKGKVEDIVVNTENIDYTKLGKYEAQYTLFDRTYSLTVQIVDTKAPLVEVKEGETDAKVEVDPNDLIANIDDATTTKVTYKEDYSFTEPGDLSVVLVISDEGNNVTEATTVIHILPEDTTPPQISAEDTVTLQINSTFDPLESIDIADNQDPNPTLEVLSNNVNTNKTGSYQVVYQGKDRSGNTCKLEKTIKIVEFSKIGRNYSTDEKIVYLTFDDGPSYNTEEILKILDQYQIKATFFVTGNGGEYSDCILKAHNQGHTIGLHTYSHDYSIYQSQKTFFEDLNKIGDLVENLIGYRPHYIRFPGGSSNTVSKNYKTGIMSELSQEVINRGYQYYDWNVTSGDAGGNNVDVDYIVEHATKLHDGNLVVLFHDARGKDTTVEALPRVIEYYRNLGFRFAAINDESYTCHHGINN